MKPLHSTGETELPPMICGACRFECYGADAITEMTIHMENEHSAPTAKAVTDTKRVGHRIPHLDGIDAQDVHTGAMCKGCGKDLSECACSVFIDSEHWKCFECGARCTMGDACFNCGYSKGYQPPEIKALIAQAVEERLIKELSKLVDRSDVAWVKRGDLDSHEIFVHTNIIRDRITELRTSAKRKDLDGRN